MTLDRICLAASPHEAMYKGYVVPYIVHPLRVMTKLTLQRPANVVEPNGGRAGLPRRRP